MRLATQEPFARASPLGAPESGACFRRPTQARLAVASDLKMHLLLERAGFSAVLFSIAWVFSAMCRSMRANQRSALVDGIEAKKYPLTLMRFGLSEEREALIAHGDRAV